jgi:hypothetical protein
MMLRLSLRQIPPNRKALRDLHKRRFVRAILVAITWCGPGAEHDEARRARMVWAMPGSCVMSVICVMRGCSPRTPGRDPVGSFARFRYRFIA